MLVTVDILTVVNPGKVWLLKAEKSGYMANSLMTLYPMSGISIESLVTRNCTDKMVSLFSS